MTTIYDDPFAQRVLLAELSPYDVVAEEVVTKYVATETINTLPTDSPANQRYDGVILDDVYFERSMFAGDRIGGRSLPDRGLMTIINTKEAGRNASRFDDWLDSSKYAWNSRGIKWYLWDKRQAFSTKIQLLDGVIDGLDFDENTISFRVKSKAHLLDKVFLLNRYAGKTADDGGNELIGKPKPICLGQISNIEPVLINNSTLRYQFHNGAAEANDETRDKGVALTISTDYANVLTSGIIDLVAAPDGRVTMDAKGSTLGGGYSAAVADLLQWIVEEIGGITSIDTASIAALNSAIPCISGFYSGTEELNALDVMDALCEGVWGFYGFNRAGEFDVGYFRAADSAPDLSITQNDITDGSMAIQSLGIPAWKVNYYYRPNGAVQSQDEMAGSVSAEDRALYSKNYQRTITKSDATVKVKYPEAREINVFSQTYCDNGSDARADERLDFWKEPRIVLSAQTNLKPLQVELNQTINITHPRYNLAAGKNFRVIRFREFYMQGRTEIGAVG